MVGPIKDISCLVSQCYTDAREAIGPFPTSAIARLKQLYDLIVSREADATLAFAALIELDAIALAFDLLCIRLRHALVLDSALVGVRASRALRLVCPAEEICLEPG